MSIDTFLHLAKSMAVSRLGDASPRESLPLGLEIGDTLRLNEARFIVMADARVAWPEGDLRVAAHGHALLHGQQHHRFFLSDGRSLLHVVVGGAGVPPTVRLFQTRDEVHPASGEEWAFWLDSGDGYIGYPVFQTPDGIEYGRIWTPGAGRVAPLRFSERLRYLEGGRIDSRTLDHTAMLYGREVGGAREYVLVSAVDSGHEAWVEILDGVDLDLLDIER